MGKVSLIQTFDYTEIVQYNFYLFVCVSGAKQIGNKILINFLSHLILVSVLLTSFRRSLTYTEVVKLKWEISGKNKFSNRIIWEWFGINLPSNGYAHQRCPNYHRHSNRSLDVERDCTLVPELRIENLDVVSSRRVEVVVSVNILVSVEVWMLLCLLLSLVWVLIVL